MPLDTLWETSDDAVQIALVLGSSCLESWLSSWVEVGAGCERCNLSAHHVTDVCLSLKSGEPCMRAIGCIRQHRVIHAVFHLQVVTTYVWLLSI